MTKYRYQIPGLIGIVVTGSLYQTAIYAENTDSQPSPTCTLCPSAAGWELDIKAGPGYVSGDNFKFGDYTGLDDDGLYLFGDIFARYWGENAEFVRFEGYRLGQDSRALFIEGGKQGLYKVRTSYQGIPRRIFDTTSTPYQGSGNDTLNLPASWVRASTTQGMSQLGNSLQRVKIERDWDIYNVGAAYTPTSNWAFDLNFRRQERDGNAISSGSFFLDAAEFSSPVDDATDEFEVSAAYNADTWQVNLSYTGSFYDNDNSSLSWDNAYTAQAPGADTGRLALAPDNESHQITLAGSMLLPARTTVNGQISLGRMKQDEGFQSYTSNTQIATSALPRSSADAEVDTTLINLRAVSSPLKKLTLKGKLRYNERDNKTSENVYNYVVTDLFNATNSATNQAYNYQRYDYGLSGEYRLPARIRVSAGYDYERYERTRQVRNETTTDNLWAQLRTTLLDTADINIKAYTEDRDGSSYNALANAENPRMRQFNLTDRERDGIVASVSTYASERLNIGAELEYNKDSYDNTDIGLKKSRYKRYGFDASYLFGEDISAYTSIYKEDVKARQANSQSFANPDWVGRTEDTFYTTTTGIRYPDILGRMDASLEYSYSRSDGETKNDTSGLESEFPKLRSKFHQVKLGLEYPYSKSVSLGFNYRYEKFKADDWMLENVDAATVPNLLSLGADPYDYDTHLFFISARYMFDSRGQSGPRLGNTSPN